MSLQILVTGATGGLGGAVVKALLAKGVQANTIGAMAREASKGKLKDFQAKGVNVRIGDYTNPGSLATAFKGVTNLLFVSSGTLDKRIEQHQNVITSAKTAGVKHILYTSFLNATATSKFSANKDHVATEDALKKSGIPYTIFRDAFYAELIPFMFGDAAQTGKLVYAGGKGKVSWVVKDDIGQAAAEVLKAPGPHANKVYNITGSKSYSYEELAGAISKVVGKPVTYTPVDSKTFREKMVALKLPEVVVTLFVTAAEGAAAGEFDIADPQLEKLLGKKPTTLEAFLPNAFKKGAAAGGGH